MNVCVCFSASEICEKSCPLELVISFIYLDLFQIHSAASIAFFLLLVLEVVAEKPLSIGNLLVKESSELSLNTIHIIYLTGICIVTASVIVLLCACLLFIARYTVSNYTNLTSIYLWFFNINITITAYTHPFIGHIYSHWTHLTLLPSEVKCETIYGMELIINKYEMHVYTE